MKRIGIKTGLLRVALGLLNFGAAASLQFLMWRNRLWNEGAWTRKDAKAPARTKKGLGENPARLIFQADR